MAIWLLTVVAVVDGATGFVAKNIAAATTVAAFSPLLGCLRLPTYGGLDEKPNGPVEVHR